MYAYVFIPRLNHCERDLMQKKTLMEDIRLKLKIAEENAASDASVLVLIVFARYHYAKLLSLFIILFSLI